MKKIVLIIVILVGVGGLIELLRFNPQPSRVGAAAGASDSGSQTAATATPAAAYKDGSYTGSTVDVGYGPVQVQAVVSGGKLTGVNFLQMPFDRSQSQMIADQAKPLLLQEALQAQSANVDAVSGATADSTGFAQSLQSALSQAQS